MKTKALNILTKIKKVNPALLAINFLLSFFIFRYIYEGFFARYWVDDFCTAGDIKIKGFLETQVADYLGWSGRFSFRGLTSLFMAIFDSASAKIVPTLITLLLVTLLYLFFKKFFTYLNGESNVLKALLVSQSIVFLLYYSAPNLFEDLYWQAGSITYLFPLIGFLILINLLLSYKIKKKKTFLYLIFLTSFLTGGLSEIYALFQAIFLGTISLYFVVKKKWALSFYLGLLGAIFSLILIVIAPGNKVRMSKFDNNLNLKETLLVTFNSTIDYLHNIPSNKLILGIIILFLIPFFSQLFIKKITKKLALSLIGAVGLTIPLVLFISIFPSYYGTGSFPETRTFIIPHFFILFCAFFIGILARSIIEEYLDKTSKKILPIIILIGFIPVFGLFAKEIGNDFFQHKSQWVEFGRNWDKRHLEIKNSEEKTIIIDQFNMLGRENISEKISEKSGFWTNYCMGLYYNKRIKAKESNY